MAVSYSSCAVSPLEMHKRTHTNTLVYILYIHMCMHTRHTQTERGIKVTCNSAASHHFAPLPLSSPKKNKAAAAKMNLKEGSGGQPLDALSQLCRC